MTDDGGGSKEDGSTELPTRLAYRLDALDDLPEPVRALYKPGPDGKGFMLDVALPDPVATAKAELKAMRSEAAQERIAVRAEKAALREGFGSDSFDEIRALVAAAREAAAEARKLADEHAAGIATKASELERLHAEKLAPIQTQAEKLKQQRDRVMISRSAATAVAEAGGSVRLIAPLVEARLRVQDDGDVPRVVVLGEDGAPGEQSIAELVAMMKSDKSTAQAFAPEPVRPKANGAMNGHAADASKMNASELLTAIRSGRLPVKR